MYLRLLSAASLLALTSADVYMKLTEDPICFVEEVEGGLEVVNMEYLVKEGDAANVAKHANREGLGSMAEANQARPFTVKVVDSENTEILNRDVGDLFGSMSWKVTPDLTGAYEICLSARSDARATHEHPIQVSFKIDHRLKGVHKPPPKREAVGKTGPGGMAVETFVAEGGEVKEVLKSVEELERIHDELQELKDRIKEVRKEGNYFSDRQHRFVKTTDSTSTRVVWFSVITVSIVVLSAAYQYYHLKAFLLKKKLV